MKKPDLTRVKSLAIASFCVLTAVGNIYSVATEKKADKITFYENQQPVKQELTIKTEEPKADVSKSVEITKEVIQPEADNPEPVTIQEETVTADHAGRINLNTASDAELQTLKGIGPTKSAAIIEYREAYGGFKSPEEIMEVKGIGEGTYAKIKDEICAY